MNDTTARPCWFTRFTHFFTDNTLSAPFWLLVRLYLGYEWIMAGWDKFNNPAWFGTNAGAALQGFIQNALQKTTGSHPDVQMWYASFLQNTVAPHLTTWANAVTLGELAIGLGLILGACTAAAAFFGFFMNLNFMLAGTVSINPIMLVLALGIMSAHKVAGRWGFDGLVKPHLQRWCESRRAKRSVS
jgi:thiosulfate dehydrogenase [quinone] large subunit